MLIMNLVYIAQFDTNGILTALDIVRTYMYTNAMCAHMNILETIIFIYIYMSTHKYIHRHILTRLPILI